MFRLPDNQTNTFVVVVFQIWGVYRVIEEFSDDFRVKSIKFVKVYLWSGMAVANAKIDI